jgi:hypothetical protein
MLELHQPLSRFAGASLAAWGMSRVLGGPFFIRALRRRLPAMEWSRNRLRAGERGKRGQSLTHGQNVEPSLRMSPRKPSLSSPHSYNGRG